MTQEAPMRGMWRRFIHMLIKSKLPYFWMAAAFLFSIAKSTVELVIPVNIAKDVEKNDPRKFVSRITTDTTLVTALSLPRVPTKS